MIETISGNPNLDQEGGLLGSSFPNSLNYLNAPPSRKNWNLGEEEAKRVREDKIGFAIRAGVKD